MIEITDDGVYREHLDIRLAAGEQLEIRAAQGCRPVIIPVETGRGRPDGFRVRGADVPTPRIRRASRSTASGSPATRSTCTAASPASGCATARSSRRRAGRHASRTGNDRRPSLVVHGMPCPIAISSSVIGRIRVDSPETGFEPLPLRISDSVLDASDLRDRAVLGADDRPAWVRLSLSRVTVLGGAEVHSVGLVEDSILTGALDCERRQTGSVRFCYLGPGSRTPKRTAASQTPRSPARQRRSRAARPRRGTAAGSKR